MLARFLSTAFIGIGATLVSDLLVMLAVRALKLHPMNICFIGRWVLYMPEGTFTHHPIAKSAPKRGECLAGWVVHYLVGLAFAFIFVGMTGDAWLRRPSLIAALAFGLGTILAPFFIMQPSFGLGIAASKSPEPAQARLRTLITHLAFGLGMFVFGLLASLWG